MSQSEKSALYQALKAAGVTFDRHYREYSVAGLQQVYDTLASRGVKLQPLNGEAPAPEQTPQEGELAEAAAFFGMPAQEPPQPPQRPQRPQPPVKEADPNELPGQRLNSKDELEPIRTDEQGRIWFQEEVRKPAYAKPRGRRVLDYKDPGAKEVTVHDGQYTETFEVAGDPANARPAQVKITLPSFQVGIYKDPRFPFRVITYNGSNGFHRDDVIEFYGGAELVPPSVKRVYVENVLCWDIRSVIAAIQTEYRERVLRQPISTGGPHQ